MENSEEIVAKVLRNLPLPQDKFAPGSRFWLTLYLEGSPTAYSLAKTQLHALGWVNLCEKDDFAGFSYPKKEVLNATAVVCDALRGALSVCKDTGLDIGLIDADTETEPANSSWHNLYKQT
ncbi:hypothetical protein [Palleronia caenipelagi]|uniref:Uncharacterized protein n=1 Tax=Palleronia caenipelagi TaxID=2489174 RepID=A0A547PIC5_9RHOB|nr:hypothetical protein [Palleronia caenipelagi]TRD13896.1 hypothetical protein FEV53_19790 [Palleronia caenipelagi]